MTGQFVEMKNFSDFEILNVEPFTIRKKSSKTEVKPRITNGCYRVYLNGDRPYLHQLIAQQFIKEYEDGDRVGFIDDNKTNISLSNLKIIKIKNKKSNKESKSLSENYNIKWDEVKNYIIDIKSTMSISELIGYAPFDLTTRENVLELVGLIREVFAAIHSTPMIFVFKDFNKNGAKISYATEAIAKQKLSKIFICSGDNGNDITAWTIYKEYVELFTYDYISFYSKDPKVFSYFRGYDFDEVEKVDMNIIDLFLKHVKEVICNNDDTADKYVNKWFAEIIQNPSCKLHTALTIIGEQGTGKNIFSDVWCKLLGTYACENISDIDHITGKFNASIENKKLVVCNELQSADTSKNLNSDKLKTIITDSTISINQKCEPLRQTENVANFIFISNNLNPVKIESRDRRYCVLKTSTKYCQDSEYFTKLTSSFTKEFYNHLFTYYKTLDLKDFNHRNIPETEAKKDIQQASKSSIQLFFESQYNKIVDISGPDLRNMYVEFCGTGDDKRYEVFGKKNFDLHVKTWCGESKGKRINKSLVKVYNIIEEKLVELKTKFPKFEDELEERYEKSKKEINKVCEIVDKDAENFLQSDDK